MPHSACDGIPADLEIIANSSGKVIGFVLTSDGSRASQDFCELVRNALGDGRQDIVSVGRCSLIFRHPAAGSAATFAISAMSCKDIAALLESDRWTNNLIATRQQFAPVESCLVILESELEAYEKRGHASAAASAVPPVPRPA